MNELQNQKGELEDKGTGRMKERGSREEEENLKRRGGDEMVDSVWLSIKVEFHETKVDVRIVFDGLVESEESLSDVSVDATAWLVAIIEKLSDDGLRVICVVSCSNGAGSEATIVPKGMGVPPLI